GHQRRGQGADLVREVRRALTVLPPSFRKNTPWQLTFGMWRVGLTSRMGLSWPGRRNRMDHIVLNDEQAQLVATALKPVQVRDVKGNVLGYIPPVWTEEDIADAKRRLASEEPRYTTAQVLEYLRSLKKE